MLAEYNFVTDIPPVWFLLKRTTIMKLKQLIFKLLIEHHSFKI